MKETIIRIFLTAIVAFVAGCALFGLSYFVGWMEIDADTYTLEGEGVTLDKVRLIIGFLMVSVLFLTFKMICFVEMIWKLSKD